MDGVGEVGAYDDEFVKDLAVVLGVLGPLLDGVGRVGKGRPWRTWGGIKESEAQRNANCM